MAAKFKIKKPTLTKNASEKKAIVPEKEEKEISLTKDELNELVKEKVEEALKGKDTAVESNDTTSSDTGVTNEESSSKMIEVQENQKDKKDEEGLKPNNETSTENAVEVETENNEEKPSAESNGTSVNGTTESTPTASVSSAPKLENTSDLPSQVSSSGDASKTDSSSNPSAMPVVSISGVTPTMSGSVLSEDTKQNKKTPLIVLFIVFVICGFVVGISILYLLSKNNFKLPDVSSVTSVLKKAPTPTIAQVTPTPVTANIAKYKISVLNGSGVAGAAARAKDDLTSAGFTVTSTGNADTPTTDTVISAKSTVDTNTLNKLAQTLSSKYTVSSQTLSLGASSPSDIVITIGKAK